MQTKKLKIIWNKSGSGSISPKIALPSTVIRDMGVNETESYVDFSYDETKKRIILEKSKNILKKY